MTPQFLKIQASAPDKSIASLGWNIPSLSEETWLLDNNNHQGKVEVRKAELDFTRGSVVSISPVPVDLQNSGGMKYVING